MAFPGEEDMEPDTPLGIAFGTEVDIGLLVAAGGGCLLDDEEVVDR